MPHIYNLNGAVIKEKIAGFDYDWTIVNPKGGKTFPSSIEDWEWFSEEVPGRIKDYHDKGFMIVIFTNQTKLWKLDQIKLVCGTLNIPMFVCVAMIKEEHKPNTIMFDKLLKDNVYNKEESFFVGDALGRKSDFSDSDKIFAENLGLKYLSPESIFMNESFVVPIVPIVPVVDESNGGKEIIIMVGYPGSGKTSIANKICESGKYVLIKGDDFKSNTPKMIKSCMVHTPHERSIVFDATNSSIKKRKLFIDFAMRFGYSVRCVHVNVSLSDSYKRNKCRQDKKQVPKIAYSVYKKHFEEPLEEEGFSLVTIH